MLRALLVIRRNPPSTLTSCHGSDRVERERTPSGYAPNSEEERAPGIVTGEHRGERADRERAPVVRRPPFHLRFAGGEPHVPDAGVVWVPRILDRDRRLRVA